jgi:hypothetical protein
VQRSGYSSKTAHIPKYARPQKDNIYRNTRKHSPIPEQHPCKASDCSTEAFVCLPLCKLQPAPDKGPPPPADRLKIPMCQAFAAEADEMQKKNVAYHCGLEGPRWQNNFANHFSWCLISTPQAAAAETSARQVAIRDCIEAANAGGYRPPKATHLIDPTVLRGPSSLPDAGRGPRPPCGRCRSGRRHQSVHFKRGHYQRRRLGRHGLSVKTSRRSDQCCWPNAAAARTSSPFRPAEALTGRLRRPASAREHQFRRFGLER